MSKQKDLYVVEKMVARVLQWGVGLSVLILISGWLWVLRLRWNDFANGSHRSEFLGLHAEFPRSLRTLWDGLMFADGTAIMALGLGVLIATPLLRVLSSLVVFAVQRERLYSALTAAVLALLALSLYLGNAH